MKITPKKYAKALAAMLETADKPMISNFLAMLRRRNHMRMLPKIIRHFEIEWLKQRGILAVDVTYPKKFAESLTALEKDLHHKMDGKVRITAHESDDLIGGFTLKIDDTLIDGSIQGKLKSLAHTLHSR